MILSVLHIQMEYLKIYFLMEAVIFVEVSTKIQNILSPFILKNKVPLDCLSMALKGFIFILKFRKETII